MTVPARPGLLEVISAFFAAERTAEPGQLWLGPCDSAEPDLGHYYDGPELHPGTPEYEAGYAEYLAAEGEALGPQRPTVADLKKSAAAADAAMVDRTATRAEVDHLIEMESATYNACTDDVRAEYEADPEAEPEWDSGDSNAYQARVEAALEPEAEL